MQILDEIESVLKEYDNHVFYGTASKLNKNDSWDYIVFARDNVSLNTNHTSLTHHFAIAIVREDYVPEGLMEEITGRLKELPGMRIDGDILFDYMVKPGSTDTVEMMVIRCYKAVKNG